MTAVDVLRTIAQLGGHIRRDGEQMRLRIPKGVCPPSLRDAIAEHRTALLELVTSYPCARCGRHAYPKPAVTCYWCARTPALTSAPALDPQAVRSSDAGAP